jgi:hypothetical protein
MSKKEECQMEKLSWNESYLGQLRNAGKELYEVAIKAVEKDRSHRNSSVEEFFSARNSALQNTNDL